MKQLKIRVYGIVQGVGFRPFVSRLAAAGGLRGSVCNKGSFVEIIVQGEAPALMRFQKDLKHSAPERSVILKMDVTEQALEPFADFRISQSDPLVKLNYLIKTIGAICIRLSIVRHADRG